ncbi:triose-phosphate transporter family-domain-containing protein [Aspergillus multicolor]|uniref:triose-phosphate transporter family-domain-containing protein n=1 Tax=Aspergillus multicolor TaxID=41759 RepID=UPI003CCCBB2C
MSAKSAPWPWGVVLCMLNWIFWSNLTILFNKWILESTPFRYPILLTTWHLAFATLSTQLLFRIPFFSNTLQLPSRSSINMTPPLYLAKIAPIGLLYSGSLVTSNMAYMYLNVGFIQMLKASGPVITLLTSALYGVTTLTTSKLANVALITGSVGLTVVSEIRFSWVGVGVQGVSLVCDAARLVLMQVLTSSSTTTMQGEGEEEEEGEDGREDGDEENGSSQHEALLDEHDEETPTRDSNRSRKQSLRLSKMDPLLSLYYTAPICALMNGILAWRAEILPLLQNQPQSQPNPAFPSNLDSGSGLGLLEMTLTTGLPTLFLNAVVGFMLNVAVFTLIGKTSGLTMTLVSIPKNILLILASVLFWGTQVSFLQMVGYAGALAGLVVYAGGGGYAVRACRAPVLWVGGVVGMGRIRGGDEGLNAGRGEDGEKGTGNIKPS